MTAPPFWMTRAGHVLAQLAAAVPCFALSWLLLRTWSDPASVDAARWIPFGVVILWIEFVLIHSGVFMAYLAAMASRPAMKLLVFAGLAAFYAVFGVGIALGSGSSDALWAFLFVLGGRFVALAVDSTATGTFPILRRSGCGAMAMIPLLAAAAFLPWPRLGLEREVIAQYYHGNVHSPHAFVGAAAIYFAVLGIYELLAGLEDPRRERELAEETIGPVAGAWAAFVAKRRSEAGRGASRADGR